MVLENEEVTVRAVQCVGAGWYHHLFSSQALVFETLYEPICGQVWTREAKRAIRSRDVPVAAASGDLVQCIAAGEVDAVPGSEGKDVGA